MRPLTEPLILSVSGRDRPGILAELTRVLADSGIELVDLEQATLQDLLALSFLVDLGGDPRHAHTLLERFFPVAGRLGLQVVARPISPEELVTLKERDLWALTILASDATAHMVATVADVLCAHDANVVSIRRLADDDLRAAEFLVDAGRTRDLDAFRRELFLRCEAEGIDVGLSRAAVYRQSKRIVVFDADSTLVAGEVIDELARRAGVSEQVAAVTHRAMAGEIDFAASLVERVSLLRGLPVWTLRQVEESLPLTEGAEEMICVLRALGYRIAVISGGFSFFTEHLRRRLGLDYAYANELEIENGLLTGRVVPPILDGEAKAERLREIARIEGVPLTQVVGVGDGANDVPMLQAAGLGVAFRAKEVAKRAADGAIHRPTLLGLLYLLGVSQTDLAQLTRSR